MSVDDDTVYWVGEYDGKGTHGGYHSNVGIMLLKGNEVMYLDNICYMDETTQEDLDEMWEQGLECIEDNSENARIEVVSDAKANALREDAYELVLTEEQLKEQGEEAYANGLDPEDNPYSEEDEECEWKAWNDGWAAAFMRDTGREYDAENEEARMDEQDRADEAASNETIARWFHEEQHCS